MGDTVWHFAFEPSIGPKRQRGRVGRHPGVLTQSSGNEMSVSQKGGIAGASRNTGSRKGQEAAAAVLAVVSRNVVGHSRAQGEVVRAARPGFRIAYKVYRQEETLPTCRHDGSCHAVQPWKTKCVRGSENGRKGKCLPKRGNTV
jgi:hypothetical protein